MNQIDAISFRTNLVEVVKDERGFLFLKMLNSKQDFDLEEAKNQVKLADELMQGQSYKVLIDTRSSFTVPTVEAKKYMAEVSQKKAEAIIVKTLANRILGNLYLKIISQRFPCKIFDTEEKAIEWLQQLD